MRQTTSSSRSAGCCFAIRSQIATDLKPIYTAPSPDAAWRAFEEPEEKWGTPYPAISRFWRNAWQQFTPFLAAWRAAGIRSAKVTANAFSAGFQRMAQRV